MPPTYEYPDNSLVIAPSTNHCNCNDISCALPSLTSDLNQTLGNPPINSGELIQSGANLNIMDISNEIDMYGSLVNELRYESGILGTHHYMFKRYKHSFKGNCLVSYLVFKKSMSRVKAIEVIYNIVINMSQFYL